MSDEDDILEQLSKAFHDDLPEPKLNTDAKPKFRGRKLYKFCDSLMSATGKDGMRPQPHAEMCNFIEDALGDCQFSGSRQTFVMLGQPRGSYKTSITTEGVPLYILKNNPNARGLITSFRHDEAKGRLYALKWHIENNAFFHQTCGNDWKPEFREDIWNDDAIVVTKRTRAYKEPSIACAALGRSMQGRHFDFIIADDLAIEDNSLTPEQRQKVYDYICDLIPILEPGGVLILVFTRQNPDDAYGKFIKIDEQRERQGKPARWRKLIHGAYLDDGSLYFPTKLTPEFLADAREIMGSKKFSSQYLNKPVSDEDKTFDMTLAKIEDFMYYTDSRAPWDGVITTRDGGSFPVNTYMTWDPSGRKYNRKSDFHGLTVAGCDPMNRLWTLEAEQKKGTPTEIINRVCNLISYYKPRTISIEDTAQLGLWIDLLQVELRARGLQVGIHEYLPRGVAKSARIEMLQPKWERGEIILKPGQHDFYKQIDDFAPGSVMDHEDIIDSYAQLLEIAQPAVEDAAEKFNPTDPEWEARRARLKLEDIKHSRAGRGGSRWAV